jgi:mRNA interferase HicA
VKGSEFLRKVQKFAKAKGLRCSFVPARGKGSHGTLSVESAFTVVKDRKKEIAQACCVPCAKIWGLTPTS